MPLRFYTSDVSFRIPKSALLKTFIPSEFNKRTKKRLSLDCIFCSDEYLLQINRSFLQHDFYTDIITFPLEETNKKTVAEIYISVDRLKENAINEKVEFEEELHRVLFHGVLHLCGFKDKSVAEKSKMRAMENEWLRNFKQLKAR